MWKIKVECKIIHEVFQVFSRVANEKVAKLKGMWDNLTVLAGQDSGSRFRREIDTEMIYIWSWLGAMTEAYKKTLITPRSMWAVVGKSLTISVIRAAL